MNRHGNARTACFAGGLALAAVWAVAAQPVAVKSDSSRMEITLERKDGTGWKSVDPALILESGDVIRFRFKASFNGFLYVTDYGTSGNYTLLFPRVETGQKNRIQTGREYMVPATEAIFRVTGPAGYESVYWLVSPVSLGSSMEVAPSHPADYHPPVLLPRCDDAVLKARGLCLDAQAGPHAVGDSDLLPDDLARVKPLKSRELTIMQEHDQSVLVAGPGTAPVIYQFRLAHK